MKADEKAKTLFASGLNCSQAVFTSFADEFGLDEALAARLSCGLGGGVGRMREVCGAVSAAAMVLGMRLGPDKAAAYPAVQEFCAAFRQEFGSIVCKELLAGVGASVGGAPEERTKEYYQKRPCAELVAFAAAWLEENFLNHGLRGLSSGGDLAVENVERGVGEKWGREAVEGLKKRGFEAVYVGTKEEACELALAEAKGATSIGWGGSETLKEIGAREKLESLGVEIRDHQLVMDVFYLSANALTRDGIIVNIDGHGNRVAASIAGPKKVVYVIGANKIVDGGVEAAVRRVKAKASPPNCVRLNKQTPCAKTGRCADCNSPDRICKVTAVFERCPTGLPVKVIVVGEALGY